MNRVDFFVSCFKGDVLNIGCYGSDCYDSMRASGYKDLQGLDIVEGNKEKNILLGDVLKMSFVNKFDVIIAGELIEHFSLFESKKFLRNCGRALRPNGLLVLSTPNKLAWSNRLFHKFDNANPEKYSEHKHVFKIEELKEFLGENGFLVKTCFCLSYDVHSSPNWHPLIYSFRSFIHNFLPIGLQEEIIIRAVKKNDATNI